VEQEIQEIQVLAAMVAQEELEILVLERYTIQEMRVQVTKVRLEQQGVKDLLVPQVVQEILEHKGVQEIMDSKGRQEMLEHKGLRDVLDVQEMLEMRGLQVEVVEEELVVELGGIQTLHRHLDVILQGRKVEELQIFLEGSPSLIIAAVAVQVHLQSLMVVPGVRARASRLAMLVVLILVVIQEHQEILEILEHKELAEILEQKELPEILEQKEELEFPEEKEKLV
jgi:hypothetical protein